MKKHGGQDQESKQNKCKLKDRVESSFIKQTKDRQHIQDKEENPIKKNSKIQFN